MKLRILAGVATPALGLFLFGCDDSDPSGEEILRRSEEHTAKSTVVFEVQAHPRRGEPEQISVYEYAGTQTQLLFRETREGTAGGGCRPFDYDPKAGRSGGGGGSEGATRPDEVERLGKVTYDGIAAWQIRYRYDEPSIEGAFPVEVTEWIARDDYRLLRAEREIFDPYGLVGQLVLVARSFDTETPCPSSPQLDPAKLAPLTEPRLENPYPGR
jgi:hypothetical protein